MGFTVFYLEDKANLWWATVRGRQYKPGFDWDKFKEMIKDHFCPISVQKDKEGEFMQLQQGNMSILEYDLKFMKLSRFDKGLKMNQFETGLNPTIKGRMSVRQYTFYVNPYDTMVNIERAMKERSNYFNEQRGTKRKGDNRGNFPLQQQHRQPAGNQYSNYSHGGQHPNTQPKVTYNACGKLGHYTSECLSAKRCFRCGSP